MKSCEMRIVTLNIAHGRGLSPYQGLSTQAGIERQLGRIQRLLLRLQPDLVCLQEVDEGSHWNRHINLLEPLREQTHLEYAFLGVHNRRSGSKPLAYGNAVLSRFPLRFAEVVAFGERTMGEKGFIYAEVELPAGRILPLVNLHLDFQSRRQRLQQVERLLEFIRAMGGNGGGRPLAPVICGDFNARQAKENDAVQVLWRALQEESDYQLLPQRSRTFPSVFPVRGLDFIMLPENCHLLEARVVRSYVSDHRPVFAAFEWLDSVAG